MFNKSFTLITQLIVYIFENPLFFKKETFMKMKNSLLSIALFGLVAAQGINAGEKEPGSDFELFVNHGKENMKQDVKRGMFYCQKGERVWVEYHGNSTNRYIHWEWLMNNDEIAPEERNGLSAKALQEVLNAPLKECEGRMVREVMLGDEVWVCKAHTLINLDKKHASVTCGPLAQYLEFMKRISQEKRSLCMQRKEWKEIERSLASQETSKDLNIIGL